MAFRTTVLLFSFVVLSFADLFSHTGTVATDKPFNATWQAWNLQDVAVLSISSTSLPVHFCIVAEASGLPHWTEYSEENCLFYGNSTANKITQNLALRNLGYLVGVYLSSAPSKDNTTVTVTLTGDVCKQDTFWDGKVCVAPTEIGNTTFSAKFEAGQTLFFIWENPAHAGSLKLSVEAETDDHPAEIAENGEMWARWSGVPSKLINDANDASGPLVFVAPRPGLWVFGIHSAKSGTSHFRLTVEVCKGNTAGAGCAITVGEAVNNATLVLKAKESMYWRHYLATGVIPTSAENTDVLNCNGAYCKVVRTIGFNVTSDQEWFVGVWNPAETGNVTFALWWNSTCIAGCETDNHGTCQEDGTCSCQIDFTGIDCATSTGLGPQYIVLIIIASLVVASAIIGFVAWAYMRRKRSNYEIVS